MELKNRLVMSPMGTERGEADGRMSDAQIDYYMERARGGIGMIIVEGQFSVRVDENMAGLLCYALGIITGLFFFLTENP